MNGKRFEINGNTVRGLISAGLMAVALGYFIAKPENDNPITTAPIERPNIDRHEPSKVLSSRQTSTGGSRLVLQQCTDVYRQCETETYVSKFPEPSAVYPAGSTIELEDVQPPMQFVPRR